MENKLWQRILSAFLALVLVLGNLPATALAEEGGSDPETTLVEPAPATEPEPAPTPVESTPEESTPEESTPEESIPEESTPEESIPEESSPEESIPEESTPEESVPEESTPEESVPEESTPEESVPEESTPEESIPEESAPEESVPEEELDPEDEELSENEILADTISGDCGDAATWTLTDGTLTISGTGATFEYNDIETIPWYGYRDQITSLVVEEGITKIGVLSFTDLTALTSVSLPNSLDTIFGAAFRGCSSLTEVQIPANVRAIGWEAFRGCTSLSKVTFPSGLRTIEEMAFADCPALKQVTIPQSTNVIGAYSFGYQMTNDSDDLAGNPIPGFQITGARASAAYFYAKRNGISFVSNGGFSTDYFDPYTLDEDVPYYSAPDELSQQLGTIPGGTALYGYEMWEDLVKWIRVLGLKDSSGNIVWSNFTAAELADESKEPVRGWVQLPDIEPIEPTNPTDSISGTCGEGLTWTLTDGTLTISGEGSMDEYYERTYPNNVPVLTPTETPWEAYKDQITTVVLEDGVCSIGGGAFYGCTNLTTVTTAFVEFVGPLAFKGCTALTDIDLSDFYAIYDEAFAGCTGLESATLCASWIGVGTFEGCTNLSSVSFPYAADISLEKACFFGCTGLKSVTLPSNAGYIGYYAFGYTGSMDSPSKVDGFTITAPRASEAFFYAKENGFNCIEQGKVVAPDYLEEKVLSEDVTLYAKRFDKSTPVGTVPSGTTVHIVSSAATNKETWYLIIGRKAADGSTQWGGASPAEELADPSYEPVRGWFQVEQGTSLPVTGDCGEGLTWTLEDGTLTISGEGSMDEYHERSFVNNVWTFIPTETPWEAYKDQITAVVLEDGVRRIGGGAFYGCTNLTTVTTASVDSVGPLAFEGCTKLSSVTFACENGISFDTRCFFGCTNLSSVTFACVDGMRFESHCFFGCPSLKSVTLGNYTTIEDHALGYTGSMDNPSKVDGFTITAPRASEGYFYAKENGFGCIEQGEVVAPYYNEEKVLSKDATLYAKFFDKSTPVGTVLSGTTIHIVRSASNIAETWHEIYGLKAADGSTQWGGAYTDEELADPSVEPVRGWFQVEQGTFPPVTGKCGDNLTWILDFNALTISGTGKMYEYGREHYGDWDEEFERVPWVDYIHQISSIVIEEGVETIGRYAFYDVNGLSSLSLPQSLRSIGACAFGYCYGLSSVTIPAGVSTIDYNAFEECNGLTEVILQCQNANINYRAFYGCTKLKSVTIPAGVDEIAEQAFGYSLDYKTGEIVLDPDFRITGARASGAYFYAKENGIPFNQNGVYEPHYEDPYISDEALPVRKAEDPTSQVIGEVPAGTLLYPFVHVWQSASSSCGMIMGIEDASGNVTWGAITASQLADEANTPIRGWVDLSNAREILSGDCGENVTWELSEDGTLTISGTGAMADDGYNDETGTSTSAPWYSKSDRITSVVVEEGVTTVGNEAFSWCQKLASVNLPSTLVRIGDKAFYNCTALSSVVIPEGVTHIGFCAFQNCPELKAVTIPSSVTVLSDHCFGYLWTWDAEAEEGIVTMVENFTITAARASEGFFYAKDNGFECIEDGVLVPEYTFVGYTKGEVPIFKEPSVGSEDLFHFRDGAKVYISRKSNDGAWGMILGVRMYSDAPITWGEIPQDMLANPSYELVRGWIQLNQVGFQGTCGADLTWTLDNGTLTISGTGRMDDYHYNIDEPEDSTPAPWYDPREQITSVVVESGVTYIGFFAFYGLEKVTSVSLPESLTYIEAHAFRSCSSLTSVTIPKNITIIQWCLFQDCVSLREVNLPEGLERVEESAFSGCSALEAITLPSSVEWIGPCTFENCTSLTSIEIPEKVTSIVDETFQGCESLRSVVLPNGLTGISDSAFLNCASLKEITIPDSVASIGEYALGYSGEYDEEWNFVATPMADFRITAALLSEGHFYAMDNGFAFTRNGVIPPQYFRIFAAEEDLPVFKSASSNAEELDTIPAGDLVYPSAIVNAYDYEAQVSYAWAQLIGLKDESGIVWGNFSAQELTASTKEVVRGWVRLIDASDSEEDNITWTLVDGTLTISGTGDMPQYDVGCTPWDDRRGEITSVVVEEGITSIGQFSFQDFTNLTSVTLPKGLKAIGFNAFEQCINLTSITLPDSLTEIDSGAFQRCLGLTSIVIPKNVKTIGYNAFTECEALSSVTLPEGLTRIAERAFSGCTALKQITLPDSLVYIGSSALGFDAWEDSPLDEFTITATRASAGYFYAKEFNFDFVSNGTISPTYLFADTSSEAREIYVDGEGSTTFTLPGGETVYPFATQQGMEGLMGLLLGLKDSDGTIRWEKFTKEQLADETKEPVRGRIYLSEKVHPMTGSCGEKVTFSLNTSGVLTISGTGPMDSYVAWSQYGGGEGMAPWYTERNKITKIVINSGVTSIGDRAFFACSKATSVSIAASVTSIGEGAFQTCASLTSLTIPKSVTEIGDHAFVFCSGLTTVTIPGSVKRIGINAFGSCGKLATLTLEEGITEIGTGAFADCTSLKSVTIPSSVQQIDTYAFGFNCNLMGYESMPTRPIAGFQVKAARGSEGYFYAKNNGFAFTSTGGFAASYQDVGISDEDLAVRFDAKDTSFILGTISAGTPLYPIRTQKNSDGSAWGLVLGLKDSTGATTWGKFTAAQLNDTAKEPVRGWICLDTVYQGVVIGPANAEYLIAGKTLQLTANRIPGNDKIAVTWSITEGEDLATISASGLLTAKDVSARGQVTVTATPTEGGRSASLTLQIIPKTTAITLSVENMQVDKLQVDMFFDTSFQLTATPTPADALDILKWTSSAAAVATVDQQGVVTLLKPGTTTITAAATDGSGVSSKMELTVIYVDGAKTLTAKVADLPEIGLQPKQLAKLTVSGNETIGEEFLTFTSSNTAIAQVDEHGVVIAGDTPGDVTITAVLTGDPLGRKVSVKIKVIPMQAEELKLTPDLSKEILEVVDGEYHVNLSKTAVAGESFSFDVTAEARNYLDKWFPTDAIRWTTSDSAIASVTTSQGVSTVTIKANAYGECYLTAETTDLNKVQKRLWISVRDYSPRLESASLTLNSLSMGSVPVLLRESYNNTIKSMALTNAPVGLNVYSESRALYADQPISAGTYKPTLHVTCANDETYTYTLTVKITNSLPSITAKQTEKFNLFYLGSEAALSINAGDETITSVALADCDFTVDKIGGEYFLRYSDEFKNSPVAKPDVTGTLMVYLYGYRVPVTKKITVSTVTTKPTLSLIPTATTFNTAVEPDKKSTEIDIWNKTDSCYLEPDSMTYTASFATITCNGYTLTLQLNEVDGKVSGGTAKITIKQENWLQPITLTHKVTISTKLPALKLGASTLKLNNIFTDQTAETPVTLTQDVELSDVELVPTAKAGTTAAAEVAKLKVYYSDGIIHAEIDKDKGAPKAGTYAFSCKGILPNGTKTAAVTLKVNVSAAAPKVKLSTTSVKLNQYLAGRESVTITTALSNSTDYTLVGFKEIDEGHDWLGYDSTGNIVVSLTEDAKVGKHSIRLTPIVRDNETLQEATLPTSLTLKVEVYNSTKLSVTLSRKGKLDILNPASAINYTVTKMSGFSGSIDGVELVGQDADKFQAKLDQSGAKPVIHLTLVDGERYATKVTYKVQLQLTACGEKILSPVYSIKLTQSKVTLASNVKTLTLFQSQSEPATAIVTMSPGKIGAIAVSSKTSAALLEALGESGLTVNFLDDNTAELMLDPENMGLLKAGSSYTLYLDVTPTAQATNLNSPQIKLTVKVLK